MAEMSSRVKAEFERLKASDSRLAAMRKRLETSSDLSAVSEYSRRLAELTRQAIESRTDPGELDITEAQKILDELLRDNYNEVNTLCEEVQRRADKKAGIGLNPQRADYPAERVRTVAGAAAFAKTDEQKVRRLASPAENITESFHSDYVQTNAEYRSSAGLDAYIVRTDGAGCCKWCAALAGKFKYPDEIPDDIFRRHDNCTCDVSYVSSKGRQNVHTKKWSSATWGKEQDREYLRQRDEEAKAERERRIKAWGQSNDRIRFSIKTTKARFERVENAGPTKLTRAEAQAKELNLMSNSFRPKYSSEITDISINDILISTKKVENSSFNIVTDIDATKRNKAVRLAENLLSNISKNLPQGYDIPQVAVIDFNKHNISSNAIAGYHAQSGILFLNSKYDTKGKIFEYVNSQRGQFANTSEYAPILHEMGHDYYEKSVKSLAKSQNIEYNNAKDIIDGRISEYIHVHNDDGLFLINNISEYADKGYSNHSYTEIIAECFSIRDKNNYAKELFELLRGEQI